MKVARKPWNIVIHPDLPPNVAELVNLEILNLFNNHLEELPIAISTLPKLKILNIGLVSIDFYLFRQPLPVSSFHALRKTIYPRTRLISF